MKIGVIGGGTMGLTLAYRLSKAGHQVTVLEAARRLGGLATWHDYGDFTWDKFYHVVLESDSNLIDLIGDLGISSDLRWEPVKTGFLWRNRHLSMSNHWEFLTFPALTLLQKVRLGVGILYSSRIRNLAPLERMTAKTWMTKVFGRAVYEKIWEPLLESKYGVLKDRIPAMIMWATLTRYYNNRGKGDGREVMGYLSGGGFKSFFDALEARIEEMDGQIETGVPVDAIEHAGEGGVRVRSGDESYRFDNVISTVPTTLLKRMAPTIEGLHDEHDAKPQFLGVVCLALVLRRELSPYYVTNLIQRGLPFAGVIGISSLTGQQEMKGNALAMLPRYDVPESEWFDKSDEEVATAFIESIKPIWPDIEENLLRYYVHREKIVQAVWIDQPPTRTKPSRSKDGRVWSVNAELAGRDTLNNNAIIGVADKAVEEILAALEVGTPGTVLDPAPAK